MAAVIRLSNSKSNSQDKVLVRSQKVEEAKPLLTSSTEGDSINSTGSGLQENGDISSAGCKVKFRRHFYDRIPKGRSSLLVFILNVIETFAFYSAVDGTLRLVFKQQTSSLGFLISIVLQYCFGRVLYPLGGFIADAFLGRYAVIQISLWLLGISYAIFALAVSLSEQGLETVTQWVLPIIGYVFLSAGSAGFEVNIIPFGVDQLSQGASSSEMSSYFYWYYFGRQLGELGGLLTFSVLVVPPYSSTTSASIQPVVVAILITLGILLHFCLRDWFFKNRERKNPLKLVINVVWYAATVKRQMPRNRRAFRYGEGKKARIDLAKIDYDGLYSSEQVEDVKTFCRILLFIFSLGGFSISYTGMYVMLSYQTSQMVAAKTHASLHLQTYLYPNLFNICNELIILLCLPIVNHIILPCVHVGTTNNMKIRIGFGVCLNTIATISAAAMEGTTEAKTLEYRLIWLLLPIVLVSVAEMLVVVTALEFIYAQSPESMKGLLTGMFYLVFGAFSAGGALIFYFLLFKHPGSNYEDIHGTNPVLGYYIILVVLGILGVIGYVIVATLYTNRIRPNFPEDEITNERKRRAGEWVHFL